MKIKYLIVKEVQIPKRTPCRAFLLVDMAFTEEDAIEKLGNAMHCKWGKNETFALLKVLVDGITTVFPMDIPTLKETLKEENKKKSAQ